MLVKVANPDYVVGTDMEQEIAACVALCAGKKTLKKKYLLNSMLVDWLIRFKKLNAHNVKVPYYQPSCQNQYIRTFFANMKKHYGWNWSEGDFKGFKGSLAGAMMECYKARRKEFVSKRKRRYFIYFAIFSKIHCLGKIWLWQKEKGVYCAGR